MTRLALLLLISLLGEACVSFEEPEMLESEDLFYALGEQPYPRNHAVFGIVFRIDEQEASEAIRVRAELASYQADALRFASWRSEKSIAAGEEGSLTFEFSHEMKIAGLQVTAVSDSSPEQQYRVELASPFVAQCDKGKCMTLPLTVTGERVPRSADKSKSIKR